MHRDSTTTRLTSKKTHTQGQHNANNTQNNKQTNKQTKTNKNKQTKTNKNKRASRQANKQTSKQTPHEDSGPFLWVSFVFVFFVPVHVLQHMCEYEIRTASQTMSKFCKHVQACFSLIPPNMSCDSSILTGHQLKASVKKQT